MYRTELVYSSCPGADLPKRGPAGVDGDGNRANSGHGLLERLLATVHQFVPAASRPHLFGFAATHGRLETRKQTVLARYSLVAN